MRKLVLVVGLVVVVFACSEQAGQMLVDAGQMMTDAGDAMVPDAGAQGGRLLSVPCDNVRHGFEVADPKAVQVEVCGYEREPGDLGDCLYGHTFFYTGNTIYLSCSESGPLPFRLFE